MTAIAIKDFKQKKVYDKLIADKIKRYFYELFFLPMQKSITIKAKNDSNLIIEALRDGRLVYIDGVFKPRKAITNALSLELIKQGATYNKSLKGFVFKEMPKWLATAIAQMQEMAQIRLSELNSLLNDLEVNLDHYIETMVFNDEVVTILDDTEKEIQKNVRHLNIIEPELSDEQKEEIAKDYTTNMQFYIKKWSKESIISMRQKVEKLILQGYREKDVQSMLTKQYYNELIKTEKQKAYKKAAFLAQNETSIMLAELKKVMYKKMGFNEFRWNTIIDGRERELHKELNGKIFSLDNPPIIDERTGQRGLAGQSFNCRCSMTPIRRDGIFYE